MRVPWLVAVVWWTASAVIVVVALYLFLLWLQLQWQEHTVRRILRQKPPLAPSGLVHFSSMYVSMNPNQVKNLQAQLHRAGFSPANSTSAYYRQLHGRSEDPRDPDYWDGHFGPGTSYALDQFLESGGTLEAPKPFGIPHWHYWPYDEGVDYQHTHHQPQGPHGHHGSRYGHSPTSDSPPKQDG